MAFTEISCLGDKDIFRKWSRRNSCGQEQDTEMSVYPGNQDQNFLIHQKETKSPRLNREILIGEAGFSINNRPSNIQSKNSQSQSKNTGHKANDSSVTINHFYYSINKVLLSYWKLMLKIQKG